MQFNCRFHKNRLPEIDELVMVNVARIEEMGVYVNILEYGNIQGLILLTELSRVRIRSINKLIRIGRNEVAVVVRVDRDKGYIDLSKRQVSSEEAERGEEKYGRAKAVHSILSNTAKEIGVKTDQEFEDLYEKTAWFYDEKFKQVGAAYDVFLRAVRNEHELDDCYVDDNIKKKLLENIRHRFTPQIVKCRADIEVACYGYEGIEAVKAALREGLNSSSEELPIKINLIAPPLYVVTTTSFNRDEGLNTLKFAMQKIQQTIEQYRGLFKIRMEPKVVTNIDEEKLKNALQQAEDNNREISGDENDESDEDEDGETNDRLSDEDETSRVSAELKKLSTYNRHMGDDDDDDD